MTVSKKAIWALPLFLLLADFGLWACSSDSSSSVEEEEPEDLESSNSKKKTESSSSVKSDEKTVLPVLFSEVDPINLSYKDHEGDDAGWVEIYNPADSAINLKGSSLTNDMSKKTAWKFGNVVIGPKSHLLVFLSGKNYPDYVAPSDSTSLRGSDCWVWVDAQNTPVAGESSFSSLPGKSDYCFTEGGKLAFGGVMQFGENAELGWHSISAFVAKDGASASKPVDISNANELLLTGYIDSGHQLELRLAQSDLDDWKGWDKVLKGTGDSSTTYSVILPTGTTFPDLTKIYGTRFSLENNEFRATKFKIKSYIARNRGHEPHANFKIKKSGGHLYLFDSSEALVDSVAYPSMPLEKSWSRKYDSGSKQYSSVWGFAPSTPLSATQGTPVATQATFPVNALPASGFYSSSISIQFSEKDQVRCEKKGFAPTASSPLTTSLSISKTTVVRCASFAASAVPSSVETRTYIFEKAPATPAVFLTGDPNSLFDPDTGIYSDGPNIQEADPHYGANYWQDREIPIFVELMEKGGKAPAFAKNAGYQIFGNYSRANKKKSVAIVFKEKYGDKRLEYPLFPDFPELKKFKVFLLRNNGGNFGADYIRDRLCSSVSEGLGVDYQRGRGVIVYYNGEYYGIYSIRERSTEYYFETHYGLDPENIDLLKADNSASAGSAVDYVDLMKSLENYHLSSEKNYNHVAELIDVDNFMNYVHTELFMNNRDWPANNLKKWRGNNPKTKWKWFIYDMDFGFGNEFSQFTNNIFEFATAEDGDDWPNGPASTLLLRRLLENPGFKSAFINRFPVLLAMNFEKSRLLARIDAMMSEISSEISRDQERWGHDADYMSGQLEKMKSFAGSRQAVILSEMAEYFGLGDTAKVTLATQGSGKILVHGLPLDKSSMTISFFKGTPVTITAQENGGSFTGWSDKVTDKTRTINPEDVSELTAIFK